MQGSLHDLPNSFCITQVKAGDDSAYNEFASFVVKPASAVLRERLFSRSSFPLWKIASNAVAELRNFMKIVKGTVRSEEREGPLKLAFIAFQHSLNSTLDSASCYKMGPVGVRCQITKL